MKLLKSLLIVFSITFYTKCLAQVKIGDLYYDLSGNTATVAQYASNWRDSYYTNEEYIIPETVNYKDNEYTVTEIGRKAFAGYSGGSIAKKIVLPNSILKIGEQAFIRCHNLTSIIIPQSVTLCDERHNYNDSGTFSGCNLLRVIIYLSSTAPQNWTATTMTYVPDKLSYSSPKYSINNAQIIEMITFDKTEFEYTGQALSTTWTNNVQGYTASLSMPALSSEVGNHEEWIPVTFTKGEESFTANVVYRYTIKPVKLIAKVDNASREYGEENPNFALSYSGFVTGENESVITTLPTISTAATKTTNVGDYPITVSGGVATNYEFVYEPGVLTITKAPLSAKVNDATRVYGLQNPAFTIEYYGLKNNETTPAWTISPTFQTEATQSSSVGKYEVKAVNGVPVNYDFLYKQ